MSTGWPAPSSSTAARADTSTATGAASGANQDRHRPHPPLGPRGSSTTSPWTLAEPPSRLLGRQKLIATNQLGRHRLERTTCGLLDAGFACAARSASSSSPLGMGLRLVPPIKPGAKRRSSPVPHALRRVKEITPAWPAAPQPIRLGHRPAAWQIALQAPLGARTRHPLHLPAVHSAASTDGRPSRATIERTSLESRT